MVVVRYTHLINGYAAINITKLDVLTGLTSLKVGVAYELDGKQMLRMPARLDELARVKVIYKELPGWSEDITKCTTYAQLPKAAQEYIEFIEKFLSVKVRWIGVGPGRESMIDH